MDNNIVYIAILVFIGVLFLIQLYVNVKQAQNNNQTHADVIALLTKTIQDVVNNPVWLENAKAVGQSVPQDAFDAVYGKLDAAESFVGTTTALGTLMQRVEDALKRIDSNPANDPTPPPNPGTTGSGAANYTITPTDV